MAAYLVAAKFWPQKTAAGIKETSVSIVTLSLLRSQNRIRRLAERYDVGGYTAYRFVACVLAMAVSGFAAYLTKQLLRFPSLRPTALLFFEQLMARTASPRNTLIEHLVRGGGQRNSWQALEPWCG